MPHREAYGGHNLPKPAHRVAMPPHESPYLLAEVIAEVVWTLDSLHDKASRPVSRLSAAIPHVASRRTTAPCPATALSRAEAVPSMAAEGRVKGCGWHGMQGVRGSNPLSSTPGQRPSPPSTTRQSWRSRSRYAALRGAAGFRGRDSAARRGRWYPDRAPHALCLRRA
jgi:hypothetical protein